MNVYTIFNDQSFSDMLTKDIVSFEQLGTGCMACGVDSDQTLGSVVNDLGINF